MLEGGFSWSLPLANHLDRNWRLLASEVPHLKRLPSEYMHDHILFSSQPVEEAYDSHGTDSILAAWKQLDAEKRLMFSSDYPHWDYDDPKRSLPNMPEEMKRRIMAENALDLYKLPRFRASA
jgi:predicted TIM-barrel fold metal-dependent hydrolase